MIDDQLAEIRSNVEGGMKEKGRMNLWRRFNFWSGKQVLSCFDYQAHEFMPDAIGESELVFQPNLLVWLNTCEIL